MKAYPKPYALIIVMLFLILGLISCKDNIVVIPLAENSITGNVEGTTFTATDIEAAKDSNNLFTISGTINSDANFTLYFREDGSFNHPIEQDGSFSDLAEYLENLFNTDPPLADSLLLDSLLSGIEDILSDTDNLLSPNYSFVFYTIGGVIYYSLYGDFVVDAIDQELNRIDGTLTVKLGNFFGGRKDFMAVMEDIQFYED